MIKRLFPLLVLAVVACAPAGGEKVTLKEIKADCRGLAGKVLEVKVKYLGWRCPKDCGSPPLTRSDACVSDGTTCLYLKGTGGLNPLRDYGREVTLRVRIERNRKGKCYLRVLPKE